MTYVIIGTVFFSAPSTVSERRNAWLALKLEEQFVVGLICTDLRSRGDSGPQRDICSKHDRLHKKRITIHGF